MRILVVEDDYASRLKIKTLLGDYGDCDGASNGADALRFFESAHNEKVPYDLITMDIVLPDTDGKDLVRKIRQWEFAHNVPREAKEARILMVSNMKDGKSIFSSFSKGAEWYLRKPVTDEKLRESLAAMGFELE